MQVKFWGVRGSHPSAIQYQSIQEKLKKALSLAGPVDILSPEKIDNFIETLPFSLKGTFGGNTTCLELRSPDDDLFIIDCGTGITKMSQTLMKEERYRGDCEMHVFFTHTHWDHIQGLMFFGPFFMPTNKAYFYSSFADIHERLQYQTPPTHFPITFDELPVQKEIQHLPEGDLLEVGGLKITSKAVRHPGTTYSYRFIDRNGKIFIFCSDAEFSLDVMDDIVPYIEFFKNADVLVFDTQYTFEESLQKVDWGHSSAAIATDIAIKSNVKKLVLFHHDPSYDDERMDELTMQAFKYKDLIAPDYPLEIVPAYEGLEIEI